MSEMVEVAVTVARALESVGIEYALGDWAKELGIEDLLHRALATKGAG